MKIEYHLQPRSTIQEFAVGYDLTMEVHERKPSDLGSRWSEQLRFFAHFKSAETKDGSILSGEHGNGSTPEAAIADYAKRISGKLLVIDAMSNNRKEMRVPLLGECND